MASKQFYGELSETSKQEQLRHAALLERMDAEKRARRIVVPTGDEEVRVMLRKLGNPVRLFGETAADARERLRTILARVEIEGEERDLVASLLAEAAAESSAAPSTTSRKRPRVDDGSSDKKEEVYTEASAALRHFREQVATASFRRASARLASQRRQRDDVDASDEREADAARCYAALSKLSLSQSQYADERPVCKVRARAGRVATGSWSGAVKLWNARTCDLVGTLACGDDRVTGLDWGGSELLCVGLADATAQLWKTTDSPELLMTCRGHQQRLGNVAFHPGGAAFATTSFDVTWRLWDCETGTQLLLQDGHEHACYSIAFQPDGALVATGDFSGVVLVWDVRSGRNVHACLGHGKKVLAADFSPDGYRLATGSDDHAVRVWDLRRKVCDYVLPAHSSLVSDVRWAPRGGEALATAAFDGSIALWSTRDFSPLTTVAGAHDGKAMSIDFLHDDLSLVSAGFDRTFKIWE
mmetsp:Transcript_6613/g.20650  ORF Transcript_6613/g.20650 Transcript_6613/m.20650 type:complete len:472 (-) Transcript_6613:44-1459(-)